MPGETPGIYEPRFLPLRGAVCRISSAVYKPRATSIISRLRGVQAREIPVLLYHTLTHALVNT